MDIYNSTYYGRTRVYPEIRTYECTVQYSWCTPEYIVLQLVRQSISTSLYNHCRLTLSIWKPFRFEPPEGRRTIVHKERLHRLRFHCFASHRMMHPPGSKSSTDTTVLVVHVHL